MHAADQLERMNAQELREFAARLITELTDTRREVSLKQLRIDQLTHEMAILKRWKFAARSEQLHGEQRHLFDETLEADLEAIGLELSPLTVIRPPIFGVIRPAAEVQTSISEGLKDGWVLRGLQPSASMKSEPSSERDRSCRRAPCSTRYGEADRGLPRRAAGWRGRPDPTRGSRGCW